MEENHYQPCYQAPLSYQAQTACLGLPSSARAGQVINPHVLALAMPTGWVVISLQRPDSCFVA